MEQSPETQVRRIFDLMKEGLKPYLLEEYLRAYGNAFETQILEVTRPYKTARGDIDTTIQNLDSQGVFDLILKRKSLFLEKLGHVGIAYTSELLDFRNKIAHEEPLSQEDLIRVADTSWRLSELVGEIGLSQQIHDIWYEYIRERYSLLDDKYNKSFWGLIQSNLEVVNKTISDLTLDQYSVIEWLSGIKRAAISGCAGSGKTLIAIEKSIRLARAGLKVLILCHNPFLAGYIRSFTTGTAIQVFDFHTWISQLISTKPIKSGTWINYEEPTLEELVDGLDALNLLKPKFDAVIVDEGQDFRDTWWEVVEAALENPKEGILFIFHDDNQALLPLRSNYPLRETPVKLTKNCRNAGNIFEIVRTFHPQAPEGTLLLKGSGYVKLVELDETNNIIAIKSAFRDGLRHLNANRWVVLTTENCPEEESILNGLLIEELPPWSWQEAVKFYFPRSANHLCDKLSDRAYPNQDDISTIIQVARSLDIKPLQQYGVEHSKLYIRLYKEKLKQFTPRWSITNAGLRLTGVAGHALLNDMIIGFFKSERWPLGLPEPREVLVCSNSYSNIRDDKHIPIYKVSSYKGLESDGVFLFINSLNENISSSLYVGISRAKLVLITMASREAIARFPQLTYKI